MDTDRTIGLNQCNMLCLDGTSTTNIAEFLSQVEGFGVLPTEVIVVLSSKVNIRDYNKGDYIITRGNEGDRMFIVANGEITVPVEDENGISSEVILESGSIVGEMALLTNELRTSNVLALSDRVTALEILKEDVITLMEDHPELLDFITGLVEYRLSNSRGKQYIGKLKVLCTLGSGASSIVYRVHNELIDKKYAAKMLKHSNSNLRVDFFKEAKLLARLDHHNIVQIYDFERVYGTYCLIMEEIDGQDLSEIIADRFSYNKIFAYDEVLDILLQISEGLSYAHSLGVVHRDIKPANCMLIKEKNLIKITDFGIADFFVVGSKESSKTIRGTPSYIAPEVIQEKAVDFRADIYSLGIVAYEMLTGHKPFNANTVSELLKKHVMEEPDLNKLPNDVPENLMTFISKALVKEPDKRISDWTYIKGLLDSINIKSSYTEINKIDLDTYMKMKDINEQYNDIKKDLEEVTADKNGIMKILNLIIRAKDSALADHHNKVSILASAIAKKMKLSEHDVDGIRMVGLIHDIGKVIIPENIIDQPGRLKKEEYDIVQLHPQIAHRFLENINFNYPVSQIILQHHEKLDGSGYPSGLQGNDIMLGARIICVADVVEAIISDRPHRKALSVDTAMSEISENKGKLYDVDVVNACLEVFTNLINLFIGGESNIIDKLKVV